MRSSDARPEEQGCHQRNFSRSNSVCLRTQEHHAANFSRPRPASLIIDGVVLQRLSTARKRSSSLDSEIIDLYLNATQPKRLSNFSRPLSGDHWQESVRRRSSTTTNFSVPFKQPSIELVVLPNHSSPNVDPVRYESRRLSTLDSPIETEETPPNFSHTLRGPGRKLIRTSIDSTQVATTPKADSTATDGQIPEVQVQVRGRRPAIVTSSSRDSVPRTWSHRSGTPPSIIRTQSQRTSVHFDVRATQSPRDSIRISSSATQSQRNSIQIDVSLTQPQRNSIQISTQATSPRRTSDELPEELWRATGSSVNEVRVFPYAAGDRRWRRSSWHATSTHTRPARSKTRNGGRRRRGRHEEGVGIAQQDFAFSNPSQRKISTDTRDISPRAQRNLPRHSLDSATSTSRSSHQSHRRRPS